MDWQKIRVVAFTIGVFLLVIAGTGKLAYDAVYNDPQVPQIQSLDVSRSAELAKPGPEIQPAPLTNIADLDGQWRSVKSPMVEGTIAGGKIELQLTTDTTTMRYWYGDLALPDAAGKMNSKALDETGKLAWSSLKERQFDYKNGEIHFSIEMMGMSSPVTLVRT